MFLFIFLIYWLLLAVITKTFNPLAELFLFFFYQNDIHLFTNNIYKIKTQKKTKTKYIYIKPDNTTTVP